MGVTITFDLDGDVLKCTVNKDDAEVTAGDFELEEDVARLLGELWKKHRPPDSVRECGDECTCTAQGKDGCEWHTS